MVLRLVVGLLTGDFLRLLLLGLEERADPLEDIRAQYQGSGNDGLAAGDVAFSTALLVLVLVCAECPVLCSVGGLKRPVDIAENRTLNLFCLGLDDGYTLIELV